MAWGSSRAAWPGGAVPGLLQIASGSAACTPPCRAWRDRSERAERRSATGEVLAVPVAVTARLRGEDDCGRRRAWAGRARCTERACAAAARDRLIRLMRPCMASATSTMAFSAIGRFWSPRRMPTPNAQSPTATRTRAQRGRWARSNRRAFCGAVSRSWLVSVVIMSVQAVSRKPVGVCMPPLDPRTFNFQVGNIPSCM